MQDIRSFFSRKPGSALSKPLSTNEKKGSRKRAIIDSDSDEEPIQTPNKKPARSSVKKSSSKKPEQSKSKYFEVDKNKVKSLFGTEPVKQVLAPKKNDDKKVDEMELADASAAFLDMVDDDWPEMIESPTKPLTSLTEKPSTPKVSSPKKQHILSPEKSPFKAKNGHGVSKRDHELSPESTNSDSFEELGSHRTNLSPSKVRTLDIQVVTTPPRKIEKRDSSCKKALAKSKSSAEMSVLSSPEADFQNNKGKLFSQDSASPSTQGSSVHSPSTQSSSGYSSSTQNFFGFPPKAQPSSNNSSSPNRPKIANPKFQLWVDKYKPTSLKQIIGQQGEKSNVAKLVKWLKSWHENRQKKIPKPSPWAKDDSGAFFKAALLSGSPGVGKTTTAHLVCKELGLDVVEFNASDTRSKKLLHLEVTELLSTKSLNSFAQGGSATSKHHVLVMDEVDGMAGNEDRGGIQELISLIKNSKVPIICMCNDRNHPKIRSLVNYCFDLKFSKPKADQIKGAMMSICFKEGIKIKPDVLNNIITSTNQDIRLVLNHLSMLAARKDSEMTFSSKEIKLGAWDVLRQVFSETEHKNMSIHDKMDLFFHDYSIAPLFVHENYLNVIPHAEESKTKKGKIKLFAQAASSLCYGDMVDRAIRSHNAWSLLPTQALFSSYVPGELLEGHVGGMINFPAWLGKNSKKNKMDRFAQEIQAHTRLKASASVEAVKTDYARALRDALLTPLVTKGNEGIEESLSVMKNYSLLREDLDSLNELSVWPGSIDPMTLIDSKVKAAFTRAYNKNPVMTPFSISSAGIKKGRGGSKDDDALDELYEEEGVAAAVDDEEEEDTDPLHDAMITAKKVKAEPAKEEKNKSKAGKTGKQSCSGTSKRKGSKR